MRTMLWPMYLSHSLRRHICPIVLITAIAQWQPTTSLAMPGHNWLAADEDVSGCLRSSAKDLCGTAPAEYAVPSPVLLMGCPKKMYTAMLHVGNQDLEVLVDTGSAQLVLFGESCRGCTPEMKRYRPSATSVDLRMKDKAMYGGFPAGAFGDVYLDNVSFTGATAANVSKPVPLSLISAYLSGFDRDAWAMESCSNAIQFLDMPGILGLATAMGGSLTEAGLRTLGEDYYVQALIKAGMPGFVSLQLCDHDGWLWLGGLDRRHSRTGKLPTYVPIRRMPTILGLTPGYSVEVTGMSLQITGDPEKALAWKGITYKVALVDTGNRFLSMPDSAFHDFNATLHSIYKGLDDSGKYTLSFPAEAPDCVIGLPTDPETLDSDLPDFTIQLYKGPNETYPLRVKASRSYMVFHPAKANKAKMWCMEAVNVGPTVGDIGIPVLKNMIVVFQPSGVRGCIGFVPQDASTCPKAPPAPVPPSPPMPGPPPHPGNPGHHPALWVALAIAIGLLACGAAFMAYKQAWLSKLQRQVGLQQQPSWPPIDGRPADGSPTMPLLATPTRDADPASSNV